MNPTDSFHSYHYLRHNARRLEHLASLRIPVGGLSVLEIGAGIGDHSHYYIDRGCCVTITEARSENLEILRNRYPDHNVRFLDMEAPTWIAEGPYDVTHCYGLLYHLSRPREALYFLSQCTKNMLFLETCVSFGVGMDLNPIHESQVDPTQAYSGTGCRPTRKWVFDELRSLFEFVYLPKTQPWHEEFPIDWNKPETHKAALQRAIFIASRERIENELLETELLSLQSRHE
jgi:hypothetical protein